MPNLGDIFPNFEAQTTHGNIKFHDWLEQSWGVLFSHPADYTPVCTTELSALILLMSLFKQRGVKVIALSCDTIETHNGWIKDIEAYAQDNETIKYPIISDNNRELAVKLGMLNSEEKDIGEPLTCRAEILRVIDSLQLTEQKKVATPADWKFGDRCLVLPSVKEEDYAKLFPFGIDVFDVPSGKRYLRFTPQPE